MINYFKSWILRKINTELEAFQRTWIEDVHVWIPALWSYFQNGLPKTFFFLPRPKDQRALEDLFAHGESLNDKNIIHQAPGHQNIRLFAHFWKLMIHASNCWWEEHVGDGSFVSQDRSHLVMESQACHNVCSRIIFHCSIRKNQLHANVVSNRNVY